MQACWRRRQPAPIDEPQCGGIPTKISSKSRTLPRLSERPCFPYRLQSYFSRKATKATKGLGSIQLLEKGNAMVNRKPTLLASTILIIALLPGCASMLPRDVVEPKDVTVSEALKDIGKGFANLDTELGDKVLGVYPCKITVNLNLKASAEDKGKIVIDLSTKPRVAEGISTPLDPAAKANFERSGEAAAERGNTISVEMYNPACLPNNTLGYEKPEKIDDAMEGMAITKEQAGKFYNIHTRTKEKPAQ